MSLQLRQNVYAAYIDGDVTPIEALRSLCSDYEELDQTYKQFETMREQTRQQISEVVAKLGGKVSLSGFGELRITEPSIVKGFDRAQIQALINELVGDYPEVAARLAMCETKSMRAGGLRIEREKTPARK